jgi:ribonuclease inhibitor
MKYVILDGEKMTSREIAHTYLASKLNFPCYYGKNLDALWDILSTVCEPIHIKLVNGEKLRDYLGDYGQSLLDALAEAAEANEKIVLNIMAEKE